MSGSLRREVRRNFAGDYLAPPDFVHFEIFFVLLSVPAYKCIEPYLCRVLADIQLMRKFFICHPIFPLSLCHRHLFDLLLSICDCLG